MFVARSFSYTGQQQKGEKVEGAFLKGTKRESSPVNEKVSQHRGFGWRPASFLGHREEKPRVPETRAIERRRSENGLSIRAIGASSHTSSSDTSSAPTKPMAVPAKRSSRRNPYRSTPASAPLKNTTSAPSSTPRSSTAASILAQTNIPARKRFPKPRNKPPSARKVSIDELVDDWKNDEFEYGTPPGTSPAMDTLLSPPEEDDFRLGESLGEYALSPARSNSTDSMPSLERSDSASGFSCSLPLTPDISLRGRFNKGPRHGSSPSSVDSSADHPLLMSQHSNDCVDSQDESESLSMASPSLTPRSLSPKRALYTRSQPRPDPPRRSSAPSSLKSNLTASFSNLRNNLSRTFSNFAAPISNEQVARSLLGMPYHPEMRPRPMSGPPTPQMRRYMNPQAIHIYDFHVHDSHIDDADLEYVAAANAAAAEARAMGDPNAPAPPEIDVIPMDTYVRRPASLARNSATEAGKAIELAAHRRTEQRREPRENPEFLRIAVLEMQMRRAGKVEGSTGGGLLGAGGFPGSAGATSGRRGWFLPPRADAIAVEEKTVTAVPRRWSAVVD